MISLREFFVYVLYTVVAPGALPESFDNDPLRQATADPTGSDPDKVMVCFVPSSNVTGNRIPFEFHDSKSLMSHRKSMSSKVVLSKPHVNNISYDENYNSNIVLLFSNKFILDLYLNHCLTGTIMKEYYYYKNSDKIYYYKPQTMPLSVSVEYKNIQCRSYNHMDPIKDKLINNNKYFIGIYGYINPKTIKTIKNSILPFFTLKKMNIDKKNIVSSQIKNSNIMSNNNYNNNYNDINKNPNTNTTTINTPVYTYITICPDDYSTYYVVSETIRLFSKIFIDSKSKSEYEEVPTTVNSGSSIPLSTITTDDSITTTTTTTSDVKENTTKVTTTTLIILRVTSTIYNYFSVIIQGIILLIKSIINYWIDVFFKVFTYEHMMCVIDFITDITVYVVGTIYGWVRDILIFPFIFIFSLLKPSNYVSFFEFIFKDFLVNPFDYIFYVIKYLCAGFASYVGYVLGFIFNTIFGICRCCNWFYWSAIPLPTEIKIVFAIMTTINISLLCLPLSLFENSYETYISSYRWSACIVRSRRYYYDMMKEMVKWFFTCLLSQRFLIPPFWRDYTNDSRKRIVCEYDVFVNNAIMDSSCKLLEDYFDIDNITFDELIVNNDDVVSIDQLKQAGMIIEEDPYSAVSREVLYSENFNEQESMDKLEDLLAHLSLEVEIPKEDRVNYLKIKEGLCIDLFNTDMYFEEDDRMEHEDYIDELDNDKAFLLRVNQYVCSIGDVIGHAIFKFLVFWFDYYSLIGKTVGRLIYILYTYIFYGSNEIEWPFSHHDDDDDYKPFQANGNTLEYYRRHYVDNYNEQPLFGIDESTYSKVTNNNSFQAASNMRMNNNNTNGFGFSNGNANTNGFSTGHANNSFPNGFPNGNTNNGFSTGHANNSFPNGNTNGFSTGHANNSFPNGNTNNGFSTGHANNSFPNGYTNGFPNGNTNNGFSTGHANNSFPNGNTNGFSTGHANNSFPNGNTNNGFSTGHANNSFPNGYTNGFSTGHANNSFPNGYTNGFSTGHANNSFPNGNTNNGFSTGHANNSFPNGNTNNGFPDGYNNGFPSNNNSFPISSNFVNTGLMQLPPPTLQRPTFNEYANMVINANANNNNNNLIPRRQVPVYLQNRYNDPNHAAIIPPQQRFFQFPNSFWEQFPIAKTPDNTKKKEPLPSYIHNRELLMTDPIPVIKFEKKPQFDENYVPLPPPESLADPNRITNTNRLTSLRSSYFHGNIDGPRMCSSYFHKEIKDSYHTMGLYNKNPDPNENDNTKEEKDQFDKLSDMLSNMKISKNLLLTENEMNQMLASMNISSDIHVDFTKLYDKKHTIFQNANNLHHACINDLPDYIINNKYICEVIDATSKHYNPYMDFYFVANRHRISMKDYCNSIQSPLWSDTNDVMDEETYYKKYLDIYRRSPFLGDWIIDPPDMSQFDQTNELLKEIPDDDLPRNMFKGTKRPEYAQHSTYNFNKGREQLAENHRLYGHLRYKDPEPLGYFRFGI
ncbi:hypothetical protein WA158_008185 [Blastocystis sp. Blastoise]